MAVPSAPQNVRATTAGTSVTVRWDTPVSSGGKSITQYGVRRKGVVGVTKCGGAARSVTLPNIPAGSHVFQVRARNADGPGPWADSPTVTVSSSATVYPTTAGAATDMPITTVNNGYFNPTVYGPLGLVKNGDARAAEGSSSMPDISVVIYNGRELTRIPTVKASNPHIKVLAYFDMAFTVDYQYNQAVQVQPWKWVQYPTTGVAYGQAQETPREDWFLHVSGTAGGSGNRQQSTGFTGAWMMDIGNVDYQNAWAANVIAFCQLWGFDGVFADDCLASMHAHTLSDITLEYGSNATYQVAVKSFLDNVGPKLAAASLMLIPNLSDGWMLTGGTATITTWAQKTSGFMFENFLFTYIATPYVPTDWTLHLDYVTKTQDAGKMALCLSYHPLADTKAMRVGRAGMELVRDPATRTCFAYYGRNASQVDESGDPRNVVWTRDLGRPLGANVAVGTARTRQLTKGFVAMNPTGGTVQTITNPVAGTRQSTGLSIAAGATFSLAADDAEIVYF